MLSINILFLSVGRRVELIKSFRKVKEKNNLDSKLIAVDISEIAPAIYFVDKFYIVPRTIEHDYTDKIIEICIKENIKLIIPTIDTELSIMAENKERIEKQTSAKVLVSDKKVIDICRNKYNTQNFFEENGFGTPMLINIYDEVDVNYPLFIKPLDGSSSINTFKVNNKHELHFFLQYIKKPIVQEFIEGEEFTVDVFLDFDSNPITVVPRKRLAVRSGEISKGLIVKDRNIIDETKKMLDVLKPIGQVTVQCMKTSDCIKFIEINPRFGGGAPMSIRAGADSPLNLYKLLLGEKLQYNEDFKENLLSLRFDDSIFIDEKGNVLND